MTTWRPDVCIYHANCNDGFGAAWAVWKRWGDDVQYVPASYGKPITVSLSDMNVLFVDFSLPANELRNSLAKSIVVLDHHKSAEHELKSFTVIGNDSARMPVLLEDVPDLINDCLISGDHPIIASFDMDKSGARLAWEFCHPGEPLPELLAYVEDRDLWRYAFPETRAVHAALSSYPQDFDVWTKFADDTRYLSALIADGAAILRHTQKCVNDICDGAGTMNLNGHEVPTANAPFFLASDVGHELLKRNHEAPFSVTWYIANGKKHYSLRSEDTRMDVSEIAKVFGGGGHRNAAGFSQQVGGEKL